jgi:hypothetical protein
MNNKGYQNSMQLFPLKTATGLQIEGNVVDFIFLKTAQNDNKGYHFHLAKLTSKHIRQAAAQYMVPLQGTGVIEKKPKSPGKN